MEDNRDYILIKKQMAGGAVSVTTTKHILLSAGSKVFI